MYFKCADIQIQTMYTKEIMVKDRKIVAMNYRKNLYKLYKQMSKMLAQVKSLIWNISQGRSYGKKCF